MIPDSLSTEIPSSVMEGAEGSTPSSLPSAQDDALASAPSLIAEGNQNREDQQGSRFEIRDEAKQSMQTVASMEALALKESHQRVADDLPQSGEGVGRQADQKQEPTRHRPIDNELKSGSREDGKSSSRASLEGTVQRAIRIWSPRLQAATDRVREASGGVKLWAHERATRRAGESDEAQGSANPIYILAAITLGIPALLLIPLIGMNPGVQEGTLMTVLGFLLLSAFVTAVVFEIKRLADQPSDAGS
jgi:hypothetical protein